MRYRKLIGNSALVSEIGLGTWQLGVNSGWKGLSEGEAIGMVHRSLDLGINFFDTAPNYGLGTSEERLGKSLVGVDRESYVINTKFGHTVKGKTNYDSSSLRESLEGSLRRLRVDYVDSIILHNPPLEILDGNRNDHYEIMEKLKEEGKIKAYGASLDTAEEIGVLVETTASEVVEAFYNILHQGAAKAFGLCRQKGVGIIAKIPLDSGWLTGKYKEDSVFEGIRSRWSGEDIRTRARLVRRIEEIIGQPSELSHVALAFCLAHEAVSTVIPGNTSIAQLENNVKGISTPIPEASVRKLEKFYREEVEPLAIPW